MNIHNGKTLSSASNRNVQQCTAMHSAAVAVDSNAQHSAAYV